jgi:hypothetical protein
MGEEGEGGERNEMIDTYLCVGERDGRAVMKDHSTVDCCDLHRCRVHHRRPEPRGLQACGAERSG